MLLRLFRRTSVHVWEKIVRSLRRLRLDTMRTRFVVFTVLATLLSTLVMTVVLYGRNKRALSDRLGTELSGLSSEAAREMGAWVDQRVYDLRLRAAPYVVSDNLARWPPAGVEERRPSRACATTSIRFVRISPGTKAWPSSMVTGRS